MDTKTFECKLAYKTNPLLTKIDFVKAEGAVQASSAAQKHNSDWICVSVDLVDLKYLVVSYNSVATIIPCTLILITLGLMRIFLKSQ